MSTIFTSNTIQTPLPDPTIRVTYYSMPVQARMTQPLEYRAAHLLEFHPSYDDRAKFRGSAYLKPEDWMQHEAYERCGVGWLEHPYVYIREFMIHEDDRREMYRYCEQHKRAPIIIEKQPVPFPMFNRHDRVICVAVDGNLAHLSNVAEEYIGQIATVIKKSTDGGMTIVHWDTPQLNVGLDRHVYPSVGVSSINLRAYNPEEKNSGTN